MARKTDNYHVILAHEFGADGRPDFGSPARRFGRALTDREFYGLRPVKMFGALPAGFKAVHFPAAEWERGSARRDELLMREEREGDPREAVEERFHPYKVKVEANVVGRFKNKRAAEAALQDVVRKWRGGLGPDGRPVSRTCRTGYSATATPGGAEASYALKLRSKTVAVAKVAREL